MPDVNLLASALPSSSRCWIIISSCSSRFSQDSARSTRLGGPCYTPVDDDGAQLVKQLLRRKFFRRSHKFWFVDDFMDVWWCWCWMACGCWCRWFLDIVFVVFDSCFGQRWRVTEKLVLSKHVDFTRGIATLLISHKWKISSHTSSQPRQHSLLPVRSTGGSHVR